MSRMIRSSVAATGLAIAVLLAVPGDAAAQPPPRYRGAVVVRPAPYYYPGFYGAWGWGGGWGMGWGWPAYSWWGYPPPYYWGTYDTTGGAQLSVTPKDAQVFIDGYFVGVVDQFDGTWQRLRVEAGRHEIAFFQEGFRTVRKDVLFRQNGTLKLALAMEPLGPGETSERPEPNPAVSANRRTPPPRATQDRYPAPADANRQAPFPDDRSLPPTGARVSPPDDRNAASEGEFGTLSIRVQPGDAEVVVDGERWDGSDGGSRLQVQLPDGAHRVEVRKSGYRAYSANVRIRGGETTTLNVSLNQE